MSQNKLARLYSTVAFGYLNSFPFKPFYLVTLSESKENTFPPLDSASYDVILNTVPSKNVMMVKCTLLC